MTRRVRKQNGPIDPPPVQPAQCGTCIFREDCNRLELHPDRLAEIKSYLIKGTPHQCHYPQMHGSKRKVACRGGRDFQLMIWYRMGLIEAPTDAALAKVMQELGLWTKPDDASCVE